MTQYAPPLVIGEADRQDLAAGLAVGKRFKSSPVVRVADTNPVHLGHHATADGRWRIYVFADAALPGTGSATDKLADWFAGSPESPLAATREGQTRMPGLT
jgi:phenol 2-monooxygenase